MDEDKKDNPFANQSSEPEARASEERRMFNIPSTGVHVDERRGGSKFKTVALIIVVLLLLGGGFYFLSKMFTEDGETTEEETGTFVEVTPPTQTSTPTPSPSPTITRSDYTIRILNGTKTSGLAASASAKLKELGFKIERTGNATNSAFESTVIRVKDDGEDLLKLLMGDLKPDFNGEKGPDLREGDGADAEIILGED